MGGGGGRWLGGRGGVGAPTGAARGAEPPPRSAPFRGHARLPRTCSLRPQRARTLRSAAAPRCTSGEYGRAGGGWGVRPRKGELLPAEGGPRGAGGTARSVKPPPRVARRAVRGAERCAERSEALAPKPVGGGGGGERGEPPSAGAERSLPRREARQRLGVLPAELRPRLRRGSESMRSVALDFTVKPASFSNYFKN